MASYSGPEPVSRRVGDVELIALSDTTLICDSSDLAAGVSIEELHDRYPHVVSSEGKWPLAVTCYVVRSKGATIIIDTGVGNRLLDGMPCGELDRALALVGISVGDVDYVVLSHLHIDHVGWNTIDDDDRNALIFFPKAKYLVNRAEWETTMSPEELAQPWNHHLTMTALPLEREKRLNLVDPGHQITDEVSLISAPGHTSGHLAVRIVSGNERATIIGDASLYPEQLSHPQWYSVWDADPGVASLTRSELFESLADHPDHVVVAGHWPYPGIGHVVRTPEGIAFRPA
jgi:glyoxylase-like metal-dependent hydrolase (beta-lactamase superfamily II)